MNSNIINSMADAVEQQQIKAAMNAILNDYNNLQKMIEVTVMNPSRYGLNADYTVSINPSYIRMIYDCENNTSCIELSDGRNIQVRETREELMKKINGAAKSYIK